jgi:hypothetical protein
VQRVQRNATAGPSLESNNTATIVGFVIPVCRLLQPSQIWFSVCVFVLCWEEKKLAMEFDA